MPGFNPERPGWLVRIRRSEDGVPVGAGMLISDLNVITCAHVVADSPQDHPPESLVYVEFQYAERAGLIPAAVIQGGWRPERNHTGDVAVLRLQGPLPRGAMPAPLQSTEVGVWDHGFHAYGYPKGHEQGGVPARGVVVGAAEAEWLQLRADSAYGHTLSPGFSGSPVWDVSLRAVIGMVVTRERPGGDKGDPRTGYAIPTEVLARYWPSLFKAAAMPGIIGTVAGTGAEGFYGDGGPAIEAELNLPWELATDARGNVYFHDRRNFRVRKITTGGQIFTVAGNGRRGGLLSDGARATEGQLDLVTIMKALAVDPAGNVYFPGDKCVRVVSAADGRIYTAVRGLGAEALAFDPYGNLYIYARCRVHKVTPGGQITIVAGDGEADRPCEGYGDGGPALRARFNPLASSMAADRSGNLYIGDRFRVRKVTPDGRITTVAGRGDPGFGRRPALHAGALAVDSSGNLYIADQFNERIWGVPAADGRILAIAGTGVKGFAPDGRIAVQAELHTPLGLAIDEAGNLFFTEHDIPRIRVIWAVNS